MAGFKHNLLVHERTQSQVEAFLQGPTHALLIVGNSGSGKPTLARSTASNLLAIDESKIANYPYYLSLQVPEGKQEIPIEDVRELIEKLKLKTPGHAGVRRVVIIEDAQTMSTEGQNALLKTLEEPGDDTVFILTATSAKHVAPTIVSRTQAVNAMPVTLPAAQEYYIDKFDKDSVATNWALSGGAPGLLSSLLQDSAEHPLKTAVSDFKGFLANDTYGRLLNSEKISKDKLQLGYFLDAGSRVLRALQQAAVNSGQGNRAKLIGLDRKLVLSLQEELRTNANARLVGLSLALNLKL